MSPQGKIEKGKIYSVGEGRFARFASGVKRGFSKAGEKREKLRVWNIKRQASSNRRQLESNAVKIKRLTIKSDLQSAKNRFEKIKASSKPGSFRTKKKGTFKRSNGKRPYSSKKKASSKGRY